MIDLPFIIVTISLLHNLINCLTKHLLLPESLPYHVDNSGTPFIKIAIDFDFELHI